MSTNFAIHLITLPNNHGLRPLPTYNASMAKYPGPHQILWFVSAYLRDRVESTSHRYAINLTPVTLHSCKPKTPKEMNERQLAHWRWLSSLDPGVYVLDCDGSRSPAGIIGAGWALYHKDSTDMTKIFEGFWNLGSRMAVFDAELHAIFKGTLQIIQQN